MTEVGEIPVNRSARCKTVECRRLACRTVRCEISFSLTTHGIRVGNHDKNLAQRQDVRISVITRSPCPDA
jgi:hypothetical protein